MSQDQFLGSDSVKKADNPNVAYSLFGDEVSIASLSSTGGTGYVGNVSVDLTALNLDLIIPDVDVWFYFDVSLGGGISKRAYHKLPYTLLSSTGTIAEYAYAEVSFQYDNTKGTTPLAGTTFLTIYYYNATSSNAGQDFVYKIKSQRVQTIGDTVPFS